MPNIEIKAEVTGTVWKILLPEGSRVAADDTLMVVESMKMEIPVPSERAGILVTLKVAQGDAVEDGQVVAIIEG